MKQFKDGSVNGITEGNIWKEVLLFFFPILFGTFFQQLYNTVDAVVVGKFVGTAALAAVGGTSSNILNLLVGFFVGLSSGATVIIAQFWGSRDDIGVSRAVHTGIALSIVGGGLISVIGIFTARQTLIWMGTPEDVLAQSIVYLRIIYIGLIPCLIYNIGSGILRAVGDSRRPLIFLIICCFLNIVLDLLFVLVFNWGVAGAAGATVLAQAISGVLIMATLMRSDTSFKLILRKIRFHRETLVNTIKIGLPSGLQAVMYALSNILLQASINAYGTVTIAAYTAFGKLDGFYWMIIGAFGVTITTFVGQNFGARKFDRMFKCVRICLVLSLISTLIVSSLYYFAGQSILPLFTDDPAVLAEGIRILKHMAFFFGLYILVEILSGTLRGTGDSLVPMILTATGVCVLRVIWVAAVVPHVDDVLGVINSYPVSWTLTSLLFLAYYLPKKWLVRRKKAMGYLEGGE